MIHADLAEGAEAMTRILELSPDSLPELLPRLRVGQALAQQELVMT